MSHGSCDELMLDVASAEAEERERTTIGSWRKLVVLTAAPSALVNSSSELAIVARGTLRAMWPKPPYAPPLVTIDLKESLTAKSAQTFGIKQYQNSIFLEYFFS